MIMADCINYMFEQLDAAKADEPYAMPKKSYNGGSYEHVAMIDRVRQDLVTELSEGGFSGNDTALGNYRYGEKPKTFPDNWMHEPFKHIVNAVRHNHMTVLCRMVDIREEQILA